MWVEKVDPKNFYGIVSVEVKSRPGMVGKKPNSVTCPPVISGTNSRASSLKLTKFRHGTAGLSSVEYGITGNRKLIVKTCDGVG